MPSSLTNSAQSIALLSAQGWVSLRQFCAIVKVSYPTAIKMSKEGKVRCVRVGGINRVYADEIERFLKEGNSGAIADSHGFVSDPTY